MSNKLPCPSCGKSHEISDYFKALAWSEAFEVALSVPAEIANDVLRYTELFAPKKQAMRLDRRVKLMASLIALGYSTEQMKYGINYMLDNADKGTLKPPISNHNYLKKVMNDYTPEKIDSVNDAGNLNSGGLVLSERQVKHFGSQLMRDGGFCGAYARIGESQGDFMMRVESELGQPEKVREYMPYLEAVGFKFNVNRK